MNYVTFLIDFIIHIDKHLAEIIQSYGLLTYAILFLIIFVETGVVVMPLLPGDSLIFVAGAFAAQGLLNVAVLWLILVAAAIIGDSVNYWIGNSFGKVILRKKVIKEEYLEKTNKFYERHGGKTIIFARFVPIVRTIAPFVAGLGKMNYSRFLAYNVIGGLAWVTLFLFAGFFFGAIPIIKNNLSTVIFIIIFISILPPIIEYVREKRRKN